VITKDKFFSAEDHESKPHFAYIHASFSIDKLKRIALKKKVKNIVSLSFSRVANVPTSSKSPEQESTLLWTKFFLIENMDEFISTLKSRYSEITKKAKTTTTE